MDLMRILRSLEEFLYELVGWLVFYPRTFLRIIRHPDAIARYTQLELEQPPERQFTETISPVLMLILSVVLAHALEMISRAPPLETTTPVAQLLFGSEQALLLTRCVVFCGAFVFQCGHAGFFQTVLDATHVDDGGVHEALEHDGFSSVATKGRHTVLPMMTRSGGFGVRRIPYLLRVMVIHKACMSKDVANRSKCCIC